MSRKKWISEFREGIVAYTVDPEDPNAVEVVHFCGYVTVPTPESLAALAEELNTDPEFGLVGRICKDVFLMRATPEMVDFYLKEGSPLAEALSQD